MRNRARKYIFNRGLARAVDVLFGQVKRLLDVRFPYVFFWDTLRSDDGIIVTISLQHAVMFDVRCKLM